MKIIKSVKTALDGMQDHNALKKLQNLKNNVFWMVIKVMVRMDISGQIESIKTILK